MATVTVTEAHRKAGVDANCYRCPVALAIEETFPTPAKCHRTSVGPEIRYHTTEGEKTIPCPRPVSLWWTAFDIGRMKECPVPFSFELPGDPIIIGR